MFYYVYGLFKIAVIVQQIYARYKAGLTKDQRFGRLIQTVRAASRTAALAIEKGRISGLRGRKEAHKCAFQRIGIRRRIKITIRIKMEGDTLGGLEP